MSKDRRGYEETLPGEPVSSHAVRDGLQDRVGMYKHCLFFLQMGTCSTYIKG